MQTAITAANLATSPRIVPKGSAAAAPVVVDSAAAQGSEDLISWEDPLPVEELKAEVVKELVLVLFEDKGDMSGLPPPIPPGNSTKQKPQPVLLDGWSNQHRLWTGHCCKVAYLEAGGEDCLQPDRVGCYWCDDWSEEGWEGEDVC